MTAWQRVELPRPRPFTRKRIRAVAITRDAIERPVKMAAPEPLREPANPTEVPSFRTRYDRKGECRCRGDDETIDKHIREHSLGVLIAPSVHQARRDGQRLQGPQQNPVRTQAYPPRAGPGSVCPDISFLHPPQWACLYSLGAQLTWHQIDPRPRHDPGQHGRVRMYCNRRQSQALIPRSPQ